MAPTITTDERVRPMSSLALPALLHLMQLASPALPVGGFSYSEGMEAAIDAGLVRSTADVHDWIHDQLWLVQTRCELPLIHHVMLAVQANDQHKLQRLAQWTHETRESAEFSLQSRQMGASMRIWINHQSPPQPSLQSLSAQLPEFWQLQLALALLTHDPPLEMALTCACFSWLENILQAAVKSLPLGQLAAQGIQSRLMIHIPQAIEHAMRIKEEDIQSSTPHLSILSAQHETQYCRLFRS